MVVRRWKELVIDREKWRGIVRQAKSHRGAVAPTEEEEEEEEGVSKFVCQFVVIISETK
jgi:hypothetical protein